MTSVLTRFDLSDDAERETGLSAATIALRRGDLVVLPTDTVYGLAADAFDDAAVRRLLEAKGRGREMPPPVLVSATTTLDALAVGVPGWARMLIDEYWPGPLTLVCRQQSSLQWDLGDTRGTVAVRMPNHPVALDLLTRTGPLAVSSANLTGMPPATDADSAEEMLGHEVEVILDGGTVTPTAGLASTIVDCTGDRPRLLRAGAIEVEELRSALAALDVELEDLPEGA
ncbi:MAG: L-threonylcarbamoyladenylate synthase [Actinomycetota bacterium]|nr:L-threonylcarbamoyladenylate synthase [Actinomycetota bacterium]